MRVTVLPPASWRRLMVSCDGAGASHALVTGQAEYVSCVSGPVLDLVVDGTQGAISIESITAVTRSFTPVRRLTPRGCSPAGLGFLDVAGVNPHPTAISATVGAPAGRTGPSGRGEGAGEDAPGD
jgi:hypothetical protein